MRRLTTTLLIIVIGGLVLWEVLAQGTRVWMKYGILKQPLPSVMTFLTPIQQFLPMLTTFVTAVVLLIAVIITFFRARKLFGMIPLTDLSRHVVVLGPTGSGKTTVAKAIIDRVAESASIVIIDWKGEYVEYLKSMRPTVVRKIPCLWDVPGDSPREKALIAVEMLREISRDVIEVSPPSALLLLKILEEEYRRGTPTTEKIVRVLETNAELARREGRNIESNMYLALVRRLFILLIDEERKAENEEGDSRVVVYDLGGLPSVYLKTIYADYILASVYREAYREALKSGKSVNEGLRTLLVAEESQNYVRHRRAEELPSLPERLIFELRSLGVGVVLICPDPELLPQAVLRDVGTIISLSPDALPRFALERFLFRASLEEAEEILKRLKRAKMVVYYKNQLFFRRLPRPPKLKPRVRSKGDRMGVTHPWAGGRSLRAWPILPHRSPGRPATKVKKEDIEERPRPKIVEVKVVEEKTEAKPEVVEVKPKAAEEPLRLEEEEFEESETITTEPAEEPAVKVKEVEGEIKEPEPAPKGPPIPSSPLQGIALPSRAPPPYTRPLIYVIGCPAGWMNSP